MEMAIRAERLLKDLRYLCVDLVKDDPYGVIRACAMKLIVVVEEEREEGVQPPARPVLQPFFACERRAREDGGGQRTPAAWAAGARWSFTSSVSASRRYCSQAWRGADAAISTGSTP